LSNNNDTTETYPKPEIVNNPPAGTWLFENENEIIAGVSTKSWLAFLLVPFFIIWAGGSVGIIYGRQIIALKFDLFSSILGIPFVFGACWFLKIVLMAVNGKIELHLGEESYVLTGFGKHTKKRYFNWYGWNAVTSIYEEDSTINRKYYTIFIKGKNTIDIGNWYMNFVDYHRRYFLYTTIKYLRQTHGK
jgi:hypothetical protein